MGSTLQPHHGLVKKSGLANIVSPEKHPTGHNHKHCVCMPEQTWTLGNYFLAAQAFENEKSAMKDTPGHKGIGGAMPESAQKKDNEEVK